MELPGGHGTALWTLLQKLGFICLGQQIKTNQIMKINELIFLDLLQMAKCVYNNT